MQLVSGQCRKPQDNGECRLHAPNVTSHSADVTLLRNTRRIFANCRLFLPARWNRYVMRMSRKSRMGTARTYARIRTGKRKSKRKRRKKKRHGQPSVILLERGYARYAAVIASSGSRSVYEEEDPLLAPPRRSRRILRAHDARGLYIRKTGAREMKRSSRTFSPALVTQRRIFASAKSERDRLPGIMFLQNTGAN